MLSDNDFIITLWGDDAVNFSIQHIYDKEKPTVVVALLVGCLAKRLYRMLILSLY